MKRCLLVILIFFLFAYPAQAQSPRLTVSPSIIRLDLATDQPQATFSYKNDSEQTIELTFSASDFTELEHGYKPNFLHEKDAENYRYALSSWINFDKNTLVIPPHATATLTVFVDKDKLKPGGHYGSILARVTSVDEKEAVQVQPTLSSLLFVRTATGTEKEEAKIVTFVPERQLLSFPQNFIFRFQNTGDTDLIPYGLVTITDMFGRTVGKGILNEGSLISLPESIRRYSIPLKTEGVLLPGMYTASFEGHFGKTNQQMKAKIQFFSEGSVPLILISIVLTVLLGIFFYKRRK